MRENNQVSVSNPVQKMYKYVIECKDEMIVLIVEESDVLQNADEELDCPLETVLRRNHLTFKDLNNMFAQNILFIEMKDGMEVVRHVIKLNANF